MTPILTDWAMPAQINTELCLAAEEIVTNIQQYGGLPDSGQISLTLVRAAQRVILEVRDPGRAFDPLHDAHRASLGADIDSAEIGGLGVHLLTQLTDRQSYRRQGEYNILRVEKRLPRAR
jgi:sigma-B regulation protein RsbU (phosphoserine phosphatase)